MSYRNLGYFLKSNKNKDICSIFSNYLLNENFCSYDFLIACHYRDTLISSKEIIQTKDYGAGSNKKHSNIRKVSDVARYSGTNKQSGLFFHKLIRHYNINNILELGTSLGIGSAYISSASTKAKITSIEACPETYKFAYINLKQYNFNNINIINNNFDDFLNKELTNTDKFDFIFIDGNHKGEKLLEYYQQLKSQHVADKNIIVIDDINWSTDMYKAWKIITQSSKENCYLYNFKMGLVFSGYDMPQGCFPIKFIKNKQTL